MGNGKSKSENTTTDIADLLIAGFLRNIIAMYPNKDKNHKKYTPSDILEMCVQYYTIPKYIFLYDNHAFHALNITSPINPIITKNLIKTNDKSTTLNKPFDMSCYIPNILCDSPIKQLLDSEARYYIKDKDNHKYSGILSRAHSKTFNSGESSRSIYVFPNANLDGKHKQKESHNLLQSATGNKGKLLNYMLYTDEKWGIIGTGGTFTPSLYQLKLGDLTNKKFQFNEISNKENAEDVFGIHKGYQCKQYLMLEYMKDQERLFAVQCKQEHGRSNSEKKYSEKGIIGAKCGVYDLHSNKWKVASNFRLNTYLEEDEDNFKCGLCYNVCDGNKIYLVNNLGRTAVYDFHKNGWSVQYEVTTKHEMRFDLGPIIWSYDYKPFVLYLLGGKLKGNKHGSTRKLTERTNGYQLCYKRFDTRAQPRKWIDCIDKIKKSKDIDIQHMFI